MKKFILVLPAQPDENMRAEHVFPNARHRSYAMAGGATRFNWDRDIMPQVHASNLFEVEERDIPTAVEEISKWNPGKELMIVQTEKVYQRMPGTLTEKKITKEGTLPI